MIGVAAFLDYAVAKGFSLVLRQDRLDLAATVLLACIGASGGEAFRPGALSLGWDMSRPR